MSKLNLITYPGKPTLFERREDIFEVRFTSLLICEIDLDFQMYSIFIVIPN